MPIAPDYRFIAITPPRPRDLERTVDACLAAAAAGATALQVRLKDRSPKDVLRFAERLVGSAPIPVYVNDRADVARAAGAAGVHMGADDFPCAALRRVAPRPMRLGVSVGTPGEAGDAVAADADYWSVGPFYATARKADAGAALGADGFRRLATLAPPAMPVVAIGGIDARGVEAVVAAGAVGVAVISSVFDAPDVERAARDIRSALDRLVSRDV